MRPGVVELTVKPSRARSVAHAEFWILSYLLNGENANIRNLSSVANKLEAGLDPEGNLVDPVAHSRFNKAVENIEQLLNKQFLMRCRKLAGDLKEGANVQTYNGLVNVLDSNNFPIGGDLQ